MDEPLTLFILADDQLTRAGLAAVLTDQDLWVVATGNTNSDLDYQIEIHRPHLILWDLGWDPYDDSGDDLSSLERLAGAMELDLPILVLVSDLQHALAVWRMGVAGLLPRSVPAPRLTSALHALANGLRVFDPIFAADIVVPQHHIDLEPVETLTERESEVLNLLAEGMTNRAIGHALSISEHTAKFHIQSLMGKLGAQSRTEAVVRATRLGLLTL